MDDIKPMLNAPIETGITAGEEFEASVLGRMNRAHDAFIDLDRTLAESPEAQQERIAKFKEQAFAALRRRRD